MGGGDIADFGHALSNSHLFPTTWPIFVEFRSATSVIRRRKKERTRKCGNYSDVLPLKAARRDSINSEGG